MAMFCLKAVSLKVRPDGEPKKYHTGTSQETALTQHGLTDKFLHAPTLLVMLYSSPTVAATPRTKLQRKTRRSVIGLRANLRRNTTYSI
jgi:hypothetical protein